MLWQYQRFGGATHLTSMNLSYSPKIYLSLNFPRLKDWRGLQLWLASSLPTRLV